MAEIFVNGKFLSQPITGVQRYATMVNKHLNLPTLEPNIFSYNSITRTLWEQFILPSKLKSNDLLINLCNTAPVFHPNQIVTIHDAAVFHQPRWFSTFFAQYYRWLLPKIAQHSAQIVTVSEFSKSEIVRYMGVDSTKIHVIAGAVSRDLLNAITQPPKEKIIAPFALMVGTYDPRKNFNFVIEQSRQWFAERAMTLVIAGGNGAPFASQKISEADQVLSINRATDGELRWLYEHCELVIQPSQYEGFSLVPQEAIAFGKRLLVSDIPAHRETCGNNATYFDPANAESLLHAFDSSSSTAAQPTRTETDLAADWNKFIAQFI